MATLGVPACAVNVSNSGSGSCAFQRDKIKYVIAVPSDYVLTAAKLADFVATVKTDTLALRGSRIFALGAFSNSEPQITEATFDTAPDGSKLLVRNEIVNMRLEMRGASACDFKALASFRATQKSFKFLFLQANGILWGQSQWNATTYQWEMVGAKAQLVDVPMQAGATYDAASLTYLDLNFLDMRSLQDNEAWVDVSGLGIETVLDDYRVTTAILDKVGVVTTTGVMRVRMTSSCGQPLGIDYASVIDETLFKVVNMTTGSPLAITSAVANAATGVITITLTTPPSAGVVMRVTTADITQFVAAGMKYFEGIPTNYVDFTNI